VADPGACCDAVGRERALIFYHVLAFISIRRIIRFRTHHVEDVVGTQKREEGGNSNFFFLLTGRFAKRAVSARAASSKLPDSRPANLSTAPSSITFLASLCSNDLYPKSPILFSSPLVFNHGRLPAGLATDTGSPGPG
jgi:hypothetical protein